MSEEIKVSYKELKKYIEKINEITNRELNHTRHTMYSFINLSSGKTTNSVNQTCTELEKIEDVLWEIITNTNKCLGNALTEFSKNDAELAEMIQGLLATNGEGDSKK